MDPLELLEDRAAEHSDVGVRTATQELVRVCRRDAIALEPAHVEAYFALADQGRYAAKVLARDPEALVSIVRYADVSLDLDAHLEQLLGTDSAESVAELHALLRRHKRTHTLRVFLREIRNVASVRQTAAEIATIAEACLRKALANVARLQGNSDVADDICVLGMGKLGGRELNFSSDVDLIVLCRDTAAMDDDRKAAVDAVTRDLTKAMEEPTEHGYVFRVDLRLRPEGTQGPLVPSRSAFVAYYLSWGRTWERSAMVKARPVAGNLALGESALAELEPFIYRRYLDYEAIDELRAMKSKIHEHAQVSAVVGLADAEEPEPHTPKKSFGRRSGARRRGRSAAGRRRFGMSSSDATPNASTPDIAATSQSVERPDPRGGRGWDVKIGVGGIREIEFFVQALQLVHCGTRPGLRVKNTLEALDRLLYAGLLSHDDHARLADAYDFFRRLEHRLQMEHDRQTHRLPIDREHYERIAARLGFSDDETLTETINRHRDATRSLFDRLFAEGERDAREPTLKERELTAVQTVLNAPVDALFDDAVLAALNGLGFARPRQVAGQVQILREKTYGPYAERGGRSRHKELGRYMLEVAASAPDADQAFSYLTRFITTVGDRPGYYQMLSDNPHATRLLAHVFGSSGYLANPLIQDPNVFERLLGVGTFAVMRSAADMREDLARRCDDIEDPAHRLGIIRRFHQEETLRIGIHETGGAATIAQTTQQLSLLAEAVIRAVLAEVYEPLRTRRRRPGSVLPELADIPFAVVAMGKLGGEELGFGSDLDILFIYEEERQWRLEHTFFARLAQRLVRTLSTASADGKLYEVDTRLRPSGNQGALVVSVDAFDAYHRDEAATWERQALMRARPIAGPADLLEEVSRVRWSRVVEPKGGRDVRAEVAEMRDKVLENLTPVDADDVKFSSGGLIDIEFLVQAIQLELPAGDGESMPSGTSLDRSLHSQSTRIALQALSEADDVELGFDVRQVLADYEWLRRVEARLRMTDQRASSELPSEPAERAVLARRLGYQGPDAGPAFSLELTQVFDRVEVARAAYFEVESATQE